MAQREGMRDWLMVTSSARQALQAAM